MKTFRPLLILAAIISVSAAILYALWGNGITPKPGPGQEAAPAATPDDARPLIRGDIGHMILHEEPRPVPGDVTFLAEDGGRHRLDEHRGKVVLLNFWATWCPPCRREMPAFEELAAAFDGAPFVMLPVSTDRGGLKKSRAFYDEIGIETLPLYWDEGQDLMQAFAAYGKPVTILIDHRGREVARLSGPAEWASADARRLIDHFLARAKAEAGAPADGDF